MAAAVARMDYLKWSDCWNKQGTTLGPSEEHTDGNHEGMSDAQDRCDHLVLLLEVKRTGRGYAIEIEDV